MIWQIFTWITECLKLPMLKFGQIFVPHKTFEIIFSYQSYIQTKTYQSFEFAQSTKYYLCCRFPQSYSYKYRKWNLMLRAISSQIGEKHPFGTPIIYHYPKSWLYQIYIFNIVKKDKNTEWSLISIITIFPWGDKKTIAIF